MSNVNKETHQLTCVLITVLLFAMSVCMYLNRYGPFVASLFCTKRPSKYTLNPPTSGVIFVLFFENLLFWQRFSCFSGKFFCVICFLLYKIVYFLCKSVYFLVKFRLTDLCLEVTKLIALMLAFQ